jgi:hypothetical protein
MAKERSKPKAKKKVAPRKPVVQGTSLKGRALGEAADGFGKEVAVLGPRAGALTTRVGNLLLSMGESVTTGLEHIGPWLKDALSKRLKDVPDEKLSKPDPRIGVPTVEALRYSMDEEQIREMFANLLAADMNSDTKTSTHPAFVEIIKQMTKLDATLMQIFRDKSQVYYRLRFTNGTRWNEAGKSFSFSVDGVHIEDTHASVSNLQRLELIELRNNEWPIIAGVNDKDADTNEVAIKAKYEKMIEGINANTTALEVMGLGGPVSLSVMKFGIFVTPFGRRFAAACMTSVPKSPKTPAAPAAKPSPS